MHVTITATHGDRDGRRRDSGSLRPARGQPEVRSSSSSCKLNLSGLNWKLDLMTSESLRPNRHWH